MSLLLQLMDLLTDTNCMAFELASTMFASTTIAPDRNPGVRRHETPVDTRTNPTQLADPETTPWMMPYHQYSALMGFLINQGTAFIDSARPDYYPDQKRLRFSSVSLPFLEFIQEYFEGYLLYHAGITRMHGTVNYTLQTVNSRLTMHLFDVWHDGFKMILPSHFEEHFNWHTLAFWIMRNGLVQRNNLRIGIFTLGMQDKLRLQAVLLNKYGLTSTMQGNNGYLAIHNLEKWVHNVKPLLHESQLHRLVKKTDKKSDKKGQ